MSTPTSREMRIEIREPDSMVKEGNRHVPMWECPGPLCNGKLHSLDEFGLRYRRDIKPDEHVWQKQSHCRECRKIRGETDE